LWSKADGDSAFKGDKPLLGQGVESKSPEDKFNWDVAQQLKDILLERGYDVVMSKDALERESSNGGSARLATMTSDIMVSIHWNGSDEGSYNSDGSINTPGPISGTEVYYLEENPPTGKLDYSGICAKLGLSTSLQADNKKLAGIMSNKVSSVGFNNRGTTNSIYRILVYSEIPTVLIETGYGDNPSDRAILDSKRPEIAKAIADGIDEYFGN
jgi:N-acetylmuramoyl-L-alanine amidase